MFLLCILTFVVCIPHIDVRFSRSISSGDLCHKAVYVTKTGLTCHNCSKGFRKVDDCFVTGEQARCAACAPGEFNPSCSNPRYCAACTHSCHNKFQIIIKNCTAVSDLQCQCKTGYFWKQDGYSTGIGDGECLVHSRCKPGEGVYRLGTSTEDTLCRRCIKGVSYSNSSSLEACNSCTKCQTYASKCGVVNDSICMDIPQSPTNTTQKTHSSGSSSSSGVSKSTVITISVVIPVFLILVVTLGVWCYKLRSNTGNEEPVLPGSTANIADRENVPHARRPVLPRLPSTEERNGSYRMSELGNNPLPIQPPSIRNTIDVEPFDGSTAPIPMVPSPTQVTGEMVTRL